MSFCQSWYISSWRLAWLKSKMKQHSCGPEWFFSVLCFYLFIIIFFCEDIVTRRVPPLLRGCSSINSLREDLFFEDKTKHRFQSGVPLTKKFRKIIFIPFPCTTKIKEVTHYAVETDQYFLPRSAFTHDKLAFPVSVRQPTILLIAIF